MLSRQVFAMVVLVRPDCNASANGLLSGERTASAIFAIREAWEGSRPHCHGSSTSSAEAESGSSTGTSGPAAETVSALRSAVADSPVDSRRTHCVASAAVDRYTAPRSIASDAMLTMAASVCWCTSASDLIAAVSSASVRLSVNCASRVTAANASDTTAAQEAASPEYESCMPSDNASNDSSVVMPVPPPKVLSDYLYRTPVRSRREDLHNEFS